MTVAEAEPGTSEQIFEREMEGEASRPGPGDLAHWKPRFFIIWGGQAVSLIGSALTQFILLWWITDTTRSAGALGTAGVMLLAPFALFGPLGGTLADRYSRRLIMIAADAITALCMGVLILLFAADAVQLWHVYTLMFIRSSMQAFQSPAASASTSMLVPEDWLTRAAGLNQTVQGLMSIAAAPLGAVALGLLPLQGALMIDLVTALLGIVPLLFYRIPQVHTPREERKSMWTDFRHGLRLVVGHRGLAILYAVQALMIVIVIPTFTLTPLLVKNHFGGGVNQVAVMEGFCGIGMLLGGAAVSFWNLPFRRISLVLSMFGLSCAAVGFAALAPGNAHWAGVFWWFVSGAAYSIGNAPLMAILQTIVPNQMQGRAISLYTTMIGVAGPVGLALAGPIGQVLGVRALFIWGGLLAGAVCFLGFFSSSLMRIEEVPVELPEGAA